MQDEAAVVTRRQGWRRMMVTALNPVWPGLELMRRAGRTGAMLLAATPIAPPISIGLFAPAPVATFVGSLAYAAIGTGRRAVQFTPD